MTTRPAGGQATGGGLVEITGIISAVIIGAIIGGLGRLAVPGRQRIAIWLTIAIGIAAALVGTLIASIFGVANTAGVDWIELALQIGLAAIGVSIAAGRSRRIG
jgi:uncharacterized membrane protein YeaQ/YmgE (transglycosylase-associated protein family)